MNRGILGPWEAWRKIALFGVIASVVTVFAISSFPLGVLSVICLYLFAQVWKDLMVTNPSLGSYYPGTMGYKLACFFMCLKPQFNILISDKNIIGFGPPRSDDDHGFAPGMTPMTRMSSYFALVSALALSVIDFVMSPLHPFHIPWFITVPLSAVGWFVTIQVILSVKSMQGSPESIMAVEPKPQVMLSAIRMDTGGIDMKPVLIKWGAISGGLVFLTLIINIVAHLSIWIILVAILVELAVAALISISRDLQAQYIMQWQERNDRRELWQDIFGFKKDDAVPTLLGEQDLPTTEEWEAMHPEGDEPYDPSVKIAVLSIPKHHTFDEYVGYEEQLRGAIPNCNMVAVAPVGNFDANGNEVVGSVGTQAFRVWYSDRDVPKLLDPNIDDRMRELVSRAIVVNALRTIRGIGECIYYQSLPVTTPKSPTKIISVAVVPKDPAVNIVSFLNRIEDMQTALGVKWVRAMPSPIRSAPSGTIVLYISDEKPIVGNVDYINPTSVEQKRVDIMTWLYNFHVTGIQGQDGLPEYVKRGKATAIVDKITFMLPDGLTVDDVRAKSARIAATSGNQFLEINDIPMKESTVEQKPGVRLSRRQIQEIQRSQRTSFDIIASKSDPLNRMFTFSDYKSRILFPREKGVPRLTWAAGVMADDEFAFDDWESASGAHLLVAGQSGAGKSVTMADMILQLIHNNGPTELEMAMIEPKNEMQVYRNCDVVTDFVDTWSPDENFMANAADLMEKMVAEMNRRNAVMSQHPKSPKKLSKAREIAMREAADQGIPFEDHPLFMPFKIIILEECATLFADAASKEEKEDQGRLLAATVEIARKARSSGMYLVCATQYPTNASIPSVIRQQMRRIGMKCRDGMSSQVVIGQPGLEKVKVLGAGMLEPKGSNQYRMFRSFYAADGDPDYGQKNDILDVLATIPTKTGVSPAQAAGASPAPAFTLSAPSESIFDKFANTSGRVLDAAIESGKRTKDKTDAMFPG